MRSRLVGTLIKLLGHTLRGFRENSGGGGTLFNRGSASEYSSNIRRCNDLQETTVYGQNMSGRGKEEGGFSILQPINFGEWKTTNGCRSFKRSRKRFLPVRVKLKVDAGGRKEACPDTFYKKSAD